MARRSKLQHLTEEEKKERRRKMAIIRNWIKWGGTCRSNAEEMENRRQMNYTYEQIMMFKQNKARGKRKYNYYGDDDDEYFYINIL